MGSRDDAGVLRELQREGLLLFTDPTLRSVASIVAGESFRGSWWSHEKARVIYAVCESLSDHPDLIIVPLMSGKQTWVHRKLWPALLAVAMERAPWQTAGLTSVARAVLAKASRAESIRTDNLPKIEAVASKILEARLLVHGRQVHTESGAHARILEPWENWMTRARFRRKLPDPAAARESFEEKVAALNSRYGTSARLPWTAGRR